VALFCHLDLIESCLLKKQLSTKFLDVHIIIFEILKKYVKVVFCKDDFHLNFFLNLKNT
jgi:hypothetical protein